VACDTCPRRELAISPGHRGPKSRVLILGESPGLNDLLQNLPFTGSWGRVMAGAMIAAGLDPKEVRFGNVIDCLAGGGVKKSVQCKDSVVDLGSKATPIQKRACAERLEGVLSDPAIDIVVCSGEASFEAVTGHKLGGWGNQFSSWVGHPVPPGRSEAKRPFWIVPIFPVSYIIVSGMKLLPVMIENFRLVHEILESNGRLVLETVLAGSESKIRKATGPIAFDIETNGSEEITWIGVSRGEYTYSAGFSPKLYQLIYELLGESDSVKVAHNAAFDVRFLKKIGIAVNGPIFDTMLAHQMYSPDLPKSLSMCSALLFHVEHWKHLAKADMEFYNRMDSGMTLKLYHVLKQKLQEDGMLELFTQSSMPALRTLIEMTETGIRVDLVKQKAWSEKLVITRDAAKALIPVNPASPAQLSKLFYSTLGLKEKYGYGSNRITTDSEALFKLGKEVKSGSEAEKILSALKTYRHTSKLISTYADQPSIVHPSYAPTSKDDDHGGAATGRLSCQDPNIQNQPKEARVIFVPHERSTGRLIEADYSQIELRIALALAGQEDALIKLAAGEDVHGDNARKFKISRKLAKNLAYGAIYGAGVGQLQRTLKADGIEITQAELSALLLKFKTLWPKLWEWRDEVVRQTSARGYARNCYGRRRYFGDMMPPEIINFFPQSTVADVILKNLPLMNALVKEHGGWLLATIHDSFLLEVNKWEVRAILPKIKALLEAPLDDVRSGLIVPVDFKIGLRWGRMHKVRVV
jgi:DNA polymerase I-like protein with 3'-5' exonuclease and polymerase domains/uracil-DNA glycosylase